MFNVCAFCGETMVGTEVVEINGEVIHFTEDCVMGYIEGIYKPFKIPTNEELREKAEEEKVAEYIEENGY